MADSLSSAQYWVIFLQPLPEAGERIAVALAFRDADGRAWIRFDGSFAKATTVYPDLDPKSLQFYLTSLGDDLRSSSDTEATLNSYGPQVVASSPRRMESPISDQIVEMLLARYVYPVSEKPLTLVPG